MASFRRRLSSLQSDLLDAFFRLERRFFLTGGSALAGFHLGHRQSLDLDLFTEPPGDLEVGQRALEQAARNVGATARSETSLPEFRRSLVVRNQESTLVDLVVDRTPQLDAAKIDAGVVRVDTLREIAANKLCTLVGRSEIRDLVDLRAILLSGIRLEDALADGSRKDGGVDAATLAWLLDELSIGSEAELPGGVDPGELDRFRQDLVKKLRRLSHPDPGGPR